MCVCVLIKIKNKQALSVVILTPALTFVKIVIISSFECTLRAQGAEFVTFYNSIIQSTDGYIFWERKEGVCLGNRSRKNCSVRIIKSEFQE